MEKNIYFFSHNNQSKEIQDIINSSLKIYDDFRHLGTLFYKISLKNYSIFFDRDLKFCVLTH